MIIVFFIFIAVIYHKEKEEIVDDYNDITENNNGEDLEVINNNIDENNNGDINNNNNNNIPEHMDAPNLTTGSSNISNSFNGTGKKLDNNMEIKDVRDVDSSFNQGSMNQLKNDRSTGVDISRERYDLLTMYTLIH